LGEQVRVLGEVGGNLAGAVHRTGGMTHWRGVVHWEKLSSANLNGRGALAKHDALGMQRGAHTLKPEFAPNFFKLPFICWDSLGMVNILMFHPFL